MEAQPCSGRSVKRRKAKTHFGKLSPPAALCWKQGKHADADVEWDKAAADFGYVIDHWPEGPDGWYLRAVALANLHQPEKAVADLRHAIAKGFNNVEQMKTDSRLDPLRTRKDFGELLQDFERKEKSQGK